MKAILVHDEMLNSELPVFSQHPALPRVFVFDPAFIKDEGWTIKRLQFISDGLVEMENVRVFRGALNEVVASLKIDELVTQETPNHRIKHWIASLPGVSIEWVPEPPFVEYDGPVTRFTRYWKTVEPQWFPRTS
jgi:deoxyribodipyrimidine photolyase-like uncharacterized protein